MLFFKKKDKRLENYYPWLLVIAGAVGLIASARLLIEKIHLLNNPGTLLSCDLNPIVSCGSVINTSQASAFGFPNPIIGVAGFAAVIVVGMAIFAGAKFKKWFLQWFMAGTTFGILFIHWLAFQSVYNLNALCPYCMVVWAVTIPIFVYTLIWNLDNKNIKLNKNFDKIFRFVKENHIGVVILWYLVITGLILNHFWYFFGA